MHAVQTYRQEERLFDGNAYTFPSIYHSGQLKLCTSHPASPAIPGGRPQYHLNLEVLCLGLHPRNLEDWSNVVQELHGHGQKVRDEAIRGVNDVGSPVPSTHKLPPLALPLTPQ